MRSGSLTSFLPLSMAAAAAAASRLACSGLTSLSHGLTKNLQRTNDNMVFSPVSIYSALSQMAAGARGWTLSELLHVLGATCREELEEEGRGMVQHALSGCPQLGGPLVRRAFGICHHVTRTLNQPYRSAAAGWGGVPLAVDDWTSAKEQINSWVAARTGAQHVLVDSIPTSNAAAIMLANAIHFKGSLERSYLVDGCRDFHRLDGSTVNSDQFLCSNEDGHFIATHDGFKVLKMMYKARDPYHGVPAKTMAALLWARNGSLHRIPEYSMYIVLPDAHDGLWSLEDKIMAYGPSFLHDHLPECRVDIGDFRVPRFEVSFAASLKQEELGLQSVFSTQEADLGDMLLLGHNDGPLFLADMLHKAVIEVEEEDGIKAATKAVRLQSSGRVDFVADHPFVFFVVEELTGTILFTGHVLDPTSQSSKLSC